MFSQFNIPDEVSLQIAKELPSFKDLASAARVNQRSAAYAGRAAVDSMSVTPMRIRELIAFLLLKSQKPVDMIRYLRANKMLKALLTNTEESDAWKIVLHALITKDIKKLNVNTLAQALEEVLREPGLAQDFKQALRASIRITVLACRGEKQELVIALRDRPKQCYVNLQRADLREVDFRILELHPLEEMGSHDGSTKYFLGNQYRKMNLGTLNLRGVDARKAVFEEGDLSGIDFKKVDLREANLQWTNLTNANLLQAKCKKAYFAGANLSGAQFFRAKLGDAYLSGEYYGKDYWAYMGQKDLTRWDRFWAWWWSNPYSNIDISKKEVPIRFIVPSPLLLAGTLGAIGMLTLFIAACIFTPLPWLFAANLSLLATSALGIKLSVDTIMMVFVLAMFGGGFGAGMLTKVAGEKLMAFFTKDTKPVIEEKATKFDTKAIWAQLQVEGKPEQESEDALRLRANRFFPPRIIVNPMPGPFLHPLPAQVPPAPAPAAPQAPAGNIPPPRR